MNKKNTQKEELGVLYIQIPEEEKKVIQEAARRDGRSVQNWARRVLYKIAQDVVRLPPEAD